MRIMKASILVAAATAVLTALSLHAQAPDGVESKAVSYLIKVAPTCRADANCFGDAARALLMASVRGHQVGDAITGTLATLNAPSSWTGLVGVGEEWRALSRLSLAAALAAAGEKDLNPSPALVEAAKLLEADQQADGSWVPDPQNPAGTPLTYGTAVGTWLARSTLIAAGKQPDDFPVAQSDRWLRTAEILTLTDAVGVLLAMGVTSDVMADKQRALGLSIIRRAHQESGGWGPTPDAPATTFHTALGLMTLQQYEADPRLARSTYRLEELQAAIGQARAYLAAQQQADGSWPETPTAGAKPSDAQRIATTSWALIALLSQNK
jgi:hypothetical protein